MAGLLVVGCAGDSDADSGTTKDAGTATADDDAWWNVDVGTPEPNTTGEDEGGDDKGGGDKGDCYEECVGSGKPEATPEFCEDWCAGGKGDDDGGGGDDKGDPDACYDACIDTGETPEVCKKACG